MKLTIDASICIIYENMVIELQLSAEVIIIYDDENDTWMFDINYN